MAMRIILERRRTHFSASRLVWQEVRTGKIDFYHGLLGYDGRFEIVSYTVFPGIFIVARRGRLRCPFISACP
jgi:hypothetical protein